MTTDLEVSGGDIHGFLRSASIKRRAWIVDHAALPWKSLSLPHQIIRVHTNLASLGDGRGVGA